MILGNRKLSPPLSSACSQYDFGITCCWLNCKSCFQRRARHRQSVGLYNRKGRSTELLLAHLNKNWRRAIDSKKLWAFYLWTSKRRLIAFHTSFYSASCNTTLEFRAIYWHSLRIILRNGSNILLSIACLPRVLQLVKASHRARRG